MFCTVLFVFSFAVFFLFCFFVFVFVVVLFFVCFVFLSLFLDIEMLIPVTMNKVSGNKDGIMNLT